MLVSVVVIMLHSVAVLGLSMVIVIKTIVSRLEVSSMLAFSPVLFCVVRVSVGEEIKVVPVRTVPDPEELNSESVTVMMPVTFVILQSVTVVGLSIVITVGITETTVSKLEVAPVVTTPCVFVRIGVPAIGEEVGDEELNVLLVSLLTEAPREVSVQVQSVVSVEVDVSVTVIKSLARCDTARSVITTTLSS